MNLKSSPRGHLGTLVHVLGVETMHGTTYECPTVSQAIAPLKDPTASEQEVEL